MSQGNLQQLQEAMTEFTDNVLIPRFTEHRQALLKWRDLQPSGGNALQHLKECPIYHSSTEVVSALHEQVLTLTEELRKELMEFVSRTSIQDYRERLKFLRRVHMVFKLLVAPLNGIQELTPQRELHEIRKAVASISLASEAMCSWYKLLQHEASPTQVAAGGPTCVCVGFHSLMPRACPLLLPEGPGGHLQWGGAAQHRLTGGGGACKIPGGVRFGSICCGARVAASEKAVHETGRGPD